MFSKSRRVTRLMVLISLVTSCSWATASDYSKLTAPKLDRSASVAGADNNNNKIRDDIENYIASLEDTPRQKLSLMQMSIAYRNALIVDTTSREQLAAVDKSLSEAISCIYSQYDLLIASTWVRSLEKYHANTKERVYAYGRFNSAMNGTTSTSPSGDVCFAK